MTELSFKASDYVLAAAGMRVTARYSGAVDDLRLADEWEAQARAKQLPSTQTEIGAGGELIDRESVRSHLFDTVAHPRASLTSAVCATAPCFTWLGQI